MSRPVVWLTLMALILVQHAGAQSEPAAATFRQGNESAIRARFDEARLAYDRLAKEGVRAPSLYWNWAQVASASGRKGEALWALLRAQELMPTDRALLREIDRLQGELGLDPSELSLGFLGDARMFARRLRFDVLAMVAFLLSLTLAVRRKPARRLSLVALLMGMFLLAPLLAWPGRGPRAVVVQKDAPLMDAPRGDALALANLREGEVVPILSEENEYVRIQDASGARGFAHNSDVVKIVPE